jgi:hypothetical protein
VGGFGHAHDVGRALEPRPGRAADVAGEQREAGRHLDPAGETAEPDTEAGEAGERRLLRRPVEPVRPVGGELAEAERELFKLLADAPGVVIGGSMGV